MPLRRFPPRPDRPSPNGSRRDALYDQLLSSLGVSDKLPTREEYWQWGRENRATRELPMYDQSAPWPMRRYHALEIFRVITWETYRLFRETIQEVEHLDEPSEAPLPLEDAVLRHEWIQWRSSMIRQYHLEELVGELNNDEQKTSD